MKKNTRTRRALIYILAHGESLTPSDFARESFSELAALAHVLADAASQDTPPMGAICQTACLLARMAEMSSELMRAFAGDEAHEPA
jgi:hypothetical protein